MIARPDRLRSIATRYAAQGSHKRRWRRSGPRRSTPPRAVSSCDRISSHGRAPRVAVRDQARARLEDQRLDLGRRAPDHLWRSPGGSRSPSSARTSAPRWSSGSPARSPTQLAQVRAPLHLVGEPVEARLDVLERRAARRAARRARVRQRLRAIAKSHGPHAVRARARRAQRPVRAHERLLQRVLAVLAVAQHVAAEREQRRVMAVVDRLEGGRVALGDQRGEALVAHPPESGAGLHHGRRERAPRQRGRPDCIAAPWRTGCPTKDCRRARLFPADQCTRLPAQIIATNTAAAMRAITTAMTSWRSSTRRMIARHP